MRLSNRQLTDLSDDEFEAIRQRVEQNIAKNGSASDADLMKEIERMNQTAPE